MLTSVAVHVLENAQIRSLTRISRPCGAVVVISNHTWFLETVLAIRPNNSLPGLGRRNRKHVNRNFGWTDDALLPSSESWGSFAVSARQFVETYLLNSLVRALCLGIFFDMILFGVNVRHEIWNFEILMEYCCWWPFMCWKTRNFFRWREFQCIAALLWFVVFHIWFAEMVLAIRPNNSLQCLGCRSRRMFTDISGEQMMFCFTARNLESRLQHLRVSL